MERRANDQVTVTNANLMSMEERMKKMSEEEKATPMDLIEFMERNCPQLSCHPYSQTGRLLIANIYHQLMLVS